MKRKTKLLLAALAVCLLAAVIAAASLTLAAADEKNGTFNGQPAAVDEEGNLLLNSTNFPDEKFLSYVSDFDTDGDGTLSEEEADEVTIIYCKFKEIESLDGIKYFGKLETLDCSGASLTMLDVSGCTTLKTLRCYDNALTSLDLSGAHALNMLYCSGNKLEKLDVSDTSVNEISVDFDLIADDKIIYNGGYRESNYGTKPPRIFISELTFVPLPDEKYVLDLSEYISPEYLALVQVDAIYNYEVKIARCIDHVYDADTGLLTFGVSDRFADDSYYRIGKDNYMELKFAITKSDVEWRFTAALDYLLPGDADSDDAVSNSDALAVFKYLFGKDETILDTEAADINGDGEVTNADALMILQHIYDPSSSPLN